MRHGSATVCAGGSVISSPSALIIARKPSAKQLIEKLTPYQGWIGVVMFGWGIWELLGALRHLGLLSSHPVLWVFWAATGVADLVVGFLLGFGLIITYTIGNNVAAKARGEALRMKLANYQGVFGLLASALGVLYIVWIYVL